MFSLRRKFGFCGTGTLTGDQTVVVLNAERSWLSARMDRNKKATQWVNPVGWLNGF
jgi:hypothetical protein